MTRKRGAAEGAPGRGTRGRRLALSHRRQLERLAAGIPGVLYEYLPTAPEGGDRFLYVSPTCRDLLELEPEELLRDARALWSLVPREDLAPVAEAVEKAVREGAPLDVQFRVVTPSGRRRWLHARSLPAVARGAAHGAWCGVLVDETPQRDVEEELERQWQLFRRLAETSPDVICRVDTAFRVRYANPAAAALGVSPDRAVGRTCSEIGIPEDACRAWEAALRSALATRDPVRCELVTRTPNGQERHHDVVVVPELSSEGKVESLLSVGRDVTEPLAAERALREADRRKSEFLAMLSHELRNPLAPIQNALYILGRTAPGGEQAVRARGIIERQVAHLAHLVDDLLDVTRIERNRIQLQRQLLEVNELVRRVVEDHRSTFDAAGIRLTLEPSPGPLFVDADPTRLAQVVANLLHNASKFTPRGGTTTVSVLRDGGRASIVVTDNGVGMAPETLARIFEPFAQGPSGLARSRGGLGLGLALVKGLVEQHGGEVAAESAGPGQGSEFRVRLPLVEMPEAARPRPPDAPHRPFRVLVIEDNVDAANTLREVLEMSGHSVEVAYAGPEGIARAHQFHPDVILCDIGLPGMDGYDVARALRADPGLAGTHLVALSGYALPDDVRRATEAGFEVHLPKPPSVERLVATLDAMGG